MTFRRLMSATMVFALFVWHAGLAEDAAPDYAAERMELATSPDYNPYMLQLMHTELMSRHYELAQDPDTEIDDINEQQWNFNATGHKRRKVAIAKNNILVIREFTFVVQN